MESDSETESDESDEEMYDEDTHDNPEISTTPALLLSSDLPSGFDSADWEDV